MKKETKNEVKKSLATGASTAAGATAGIVIGASLSSEEAHGHNVQSPENEQAQTLQPEKPVQPVEQTTPEKTIHLENPTQPEKPVQPVEQTMPEPPTDEIEVIGYDRVTNEDGSQMDVAVLNVNGNEVGVVDVNLDGEADAIICDANRNGVIEQGEIQYVQGEGIAMQPLAEATGFNPQYAQNDLPDYVNDADVDTYLA